MFLSRTGVGITAASTSDLGRARNTTSLPWLQASAFADINLLPSEELKNNVRVLFDQCSVGGGFDQTGSYHNKEM